MVGVWGEVIGKDCLVYFFSDLETDADAETYVWPNRCSDTSVLRFVLALSMTRHQYGDWFVFSHWCRRAGLFWLQQWQDIKAETCLDSAMPRHQSETCFGLSDVEISVRQRFLTSVRTVISVFSAMRERLMRTQRRVYPRAMQRHWCETFFWNQWCQNLIALCYGLRAAETSERHVPYDACDEWWSYPWWSRSVGET